MKDQNIKNDKKQRFEEIVFEFPGDWKKETYTKEEILSFSPKTT